MKKKIIGIIICTLLLSTFLTTASAKINLKQITKQLETTIIEDDDVPVWEIGYSWTYTGELDAGDESMPMYLLLHEACFYVNDDAGDTYKVNFGGDIEGEFTIDPDTPITLILDDLTGNVEFTKSNLGIKSIGLFASGQLKIGGTTLPFPATAEVSINYGGTQDLIDFPIFVGKSWVVPGIDVIVDIKVKIFGILDHTFHFEEITNVLHAECVDLDNVTAGGNNYTAYKITYGDSRGFHYCPDVGNLVLVEFDPGDPDKKIEIIATNYPSPDNPQKPEKPSGPMSGNIGETYIYTTRAIDPNNDQIKYGWDWDGDMITDEWTSLYDSNISINTSHTWNQQGTYNIRVKARDTNGKESVWSDPLPVTMPVNINSQKSQSSNQQTLINSLAFRHKTKATNN